METNQIRCPSCNAPQEPRAEPNYTCGFCLQPFTVVDARQEEARLLAEIKAWVQQKVGSAGGAAGVDASSRAYIFNQKVFPELRRDVDRTLETLGPYGQIPLVLPAVIRSKHPNPLVQGRDLVAQLKSLRVRLESDDVQGFAVGDLEKRAIGALDERLASTLHHVHVANAAIGSTPEGYAAARRNLEVLLEGCTKRLAGPGVDAAERAFLEGQQERLRALAEACRLLEETVTAQVPLGVTGADRARALADRLDVAAKTIGASEWAPAESMPLVLGIQAEARGLRVLSRWLVAHDRIAGGRSIPFDRFIAAMEGAFASQAERLDELVESCAETWSAARGERTVPLVDDHSWVDELVERNRGRRSLGLFGTEERVSAEERFWGPVWLAEVRYSRTQGAVFRSGQEETSLAIVDACAPLPGKVVFAEPDDAIERAARNPVAAGGRELAMPASTAEQARNSIFAALRARPSMVNAAVRVIGLGFLPAVAVHYQSRAGTRQLTSCLAGRVPVDGSVRVQWQVARTLSEQFGRA